LNTFECCNKIGKPGGAGEDGDARRKAREAHSPRGDSEEAGEESGVRRQGREGATNFSKRKPSSLTHRLDNVLLHPFIGIAIYISSFT
jgi:Fe2+ transport system protein B